MAILVNSPSQNSPLSWADAISGLATGYGQYQQRQQQQAKDIEHGKLMETALNALSQRGENASAFDIASAIAGLQAKGVPPNKAAGLQEAIPKLQQGVAAQQKANAAPSINPQVQKWAYEQLGKKDSLNALNHAIEELRRLNAKGVTGPVAGRVPSALARTEEDAIRKAIDANAIQILNVHKSMFPRGLTQGEFQTLADKLISSKNTQSANEEILNAYERLAQLQTQKMQAVEQAIAKFGLDPMLPFIVSGIQKEFDDQEEKTNREMYKSVTGVPAVTKTSERSQSEPKVRKVRNKKTGKIISAKEHLWKYVDQHPEEFEFAE